MSTLLHLDASPRNDRSHSRRLSAFFVQQWRERHPNDTVLYRDLRVFTPPHVTEEWIAGAFSTPDQRTPQMRQALQLSDRLIDEFLSADVYAFGIPMSNFATPAVFKAYIDNIVRVGRTFLYVPDDAAGPYKPLVHGKRMFVMVSSGAAGYAPTGPMWPLNHLEPHLRSIFGFIGVSDITFIYAGNDMAGGEPLERSINEALAHIRQIVQTSVYARLAGGA
jgi:FMN-dependent NADH-azoreductase